MKPNKYTYLYIFLLTITAIGLCWYSYTNYGLIELKDVLFWGVLAIIAESLLVVLPNSGVGLSVGSAINMAAILSGGPFLGISTATIGFLFRFPKIPKIGYTHLLNTPYYITIFNIAQASIVSAVMALSYIFVGARIGEFFLIQTIIILLVGMLTNTIIISILVSLNRGENFIDVWISNLRGIVPSSLAVGVLGIILFLAFIGYGYGAVTLFFGPLLLARHSFKLYIEMRNLYMATIETLNKTVEAKDPYTSGHASRVEEYAVKLAEAYGLSFDKVQNIRKASILHDIGKIAINDSVLNKAEKLTEEEFDQIRRHPTVGADILYKMEFLRDVSEIVRYHHERYDGKGYPEGLQGDNIPLEACILAIADSYDAMTSDRPYREAMSREEALEEIRSNAGSQFHPILAEEFFILMSKES